MQRVVGAGRKFDVLSSLLWAMGILFLIQRIGAVWFGSEILSSHLALSVHGFKKFHWWQFLTYSLEHRAFWHLFVNGVFLYFIGRFVQFKYGPKRLLSVFFLSGIAGALVWLAFHFKHDAASLIGASAGAFGVFSYFCFACEDRPMTFLLFFVFPINLRPRVLLSFLFGLELFFATTQELYGGLEANSAHIGGMLGGVICYYFFQRFSRGFVNFKRKMCHETQQVNSMQGDSYKIYITSYSAKRSEIDRILDKINDSGFKSLTKSERNTLNSAKHLMHR